MKNIQEEEVTRPRGEEKGRREGKREESWNDGKGVR